MNRTELVAAIAEKTDLTQKATEKILAAILATVKETVACGDKCNSLVLVLLKPVSAMPVPGKILRPEKR